MSSRVVSVVALCALFSVCLGCPAEESAAPDALPPPPDAQAKAKERVKSPWEKAVPLVLTSTGGKTMMPQAMEQSRQKLEVWVREGASDPTNAWALAHGLVAFGAEHKTTDGRLAIDAIASFAEVGKNKRIDFPLKSKAGAVLEPHEALMVKSLLEAGVPKDRTFEVPGLGKVPFSRILEDAFAGKELPKNDDEWHNFPWLLTAMLIAHQDAPKDSAIRKKLVAWSLETLAYLEAQQGFLEQLMLEGRPDKVEKKKQLIYSHTCGGLHLVQAAVLGAKYIGTPDAIARARKQLEVVIFRWKAERYIYADSIAKAPEYTLLIRTQELKFYGHILETFALAHQAGVFEGGIPAQNMLRPIAQDLMKTVTLLGSAYTNLANIRKDREQTYLDLIGDGCHAIRGLRLGVVAFFRP
jgi:hypothetical protein